MSITENNFKSNINKNVTNIFEDGLNIEMKNKRTKQTDEQFILFVRSTVEQNGETFYNILKFFKTIMVYKKKKTNFLKNIYYIKITKL